MVATSTFGVELFVGKFYQEDLPENEVVVALGQFQLFSHVIAGLIPTDWLVPYVVSL